MSLTMCNWLKDSKDESVILRTINTSVVKVMSSKFPYRIVGKICKNNTILCTVNLNYYLFFSTKTPEPKHVKYVTCTLFLGAIERFINDTQSRVCIRDFHSLNSFSEQNTSSLDFNLQLMYSISVYKIHRMLRKCHHISHINQLQCLFWAQDLLCHEHFSIKCLKIVCSLT